MQTPTIFLYSLTSIPTTCSCTTKHLSAVQRRLSRKVKKNKKTKRKNKDLRKNCQFSWRLSEGYFYSIYHLEVNRCENRH